MNTQLKAIQCSAIIEVRKPVPKRYRCRHKTTDPSGKCFWHQEPVNQKLRQDRSGGV